MKRFLIDLVLIFLFVMIGRELTESETMSIEERIEQFNQQVENREVLDYSSNIHLNQTEENIAGKIGVTLGNVIYETVYSTMEMIALFFDEN